MTEQAPGLIEDELIQTPLQKLNVMLGFLGFDIERIPTSKDIHFESLLIGLDEGENIETHRHVAQVFFIEDLLKVPEMDDFQNDLNRMSTLQFLVNLPISWAQIEPTRLLLGYELMQICNRILPVGYLGLSPEKEIYFSYALRAENQDISLTVISDLLTMIGYFLNTIAPQIHAVKASQKTLQELQTAIEQGITGHLNKS